MLITLSEVSEVAQRFAGTALAILIAFGFVACGSDSSGPENESGELEVSTTTRGLNLDPDGYAITVDGGAPTAIGTSGTITVSDLPTGPIGVELTGRSSNCSVEGDNPRVVSIDAGAVTFETFQLVCGALSNSALRFNGTTHATAGDASSFDLTDRWTIEAWIKPTDLDVVEQHLVSKWGGGIVGAWALYIRDRHVQVSTRINPKNTTGSSVAALVEGEWQHVAVTFANGSARIYINGQIDAAFSGLNVPQITTTPLTLGYSSAFACCFFIGELDEVRIWNVDRSPQEILGAMDRQLLGDEPGLSVYWRLDEGSGDVSANAAGAGLSIQLGSAPGPDQADPAWSSPGEPQER